MIDHFTDKSFPTIDCTVLTAKQISTISWVRRKRITASYHRHGSSGLPVKQWHFRHLLQWCRHVPMWLLRVIEKITTDNLRRQLLQIRRLSVVIFFNFYKYISQYWQWLGWTADGYCSDNQPTTLNVSSMYSFNWN